MYQMVQSIGSAPADSQSSVSLAVAVVVLAGVVGQIGQVELAGELTACLLLAQHGERGKVRFEHTVVLGLEGAVLGLAVDGGGLVGGRRGVSALEVSVGGFGGRHHVGVVDLDGNLRAVLLRDQREVVDAGLGCGWSW